MHEHAAPVPFDERASRTVEEALAAHAGLAGALLPILHHIQDRIGYVPEQAHPRIAEALNLSRAEVHGVVSFYHDFRKRPPGRTVVRVCRAEACQAMGADALAGHAQARLRVGFGETREDAAVTLEPVYCLGNCACAPAIMIDGRLHGRITPARFDALLSGVDEESA